MYCKTHRPVNTPGVSDNKGKCVQLVEYLSKESQDERPYYDNFFSQKEEIDYFETSAKTGENVQDVFYRIERQAYQKLKLKRMKIDDEAEITNNEKQANKCSC